AKGACPTWKSLKTILNLLLEAILILRTPATTEGRLPVVFALNRERHPHVRVARAVEVNYVGFHHLNLRADFLGAAFEVVCLAVVERRVERDEAMELRGEARCLRCVRRSEIRGSALERNLQASRRGVRRCIDKEYRIAS